ncbi:glycosyltransferase family 2 protein [Nonomuraea sp. NPDC059194]|uniref:glycosyltransferase family 2 protein n=1 Tax=Nonomuraea sp. NPDC059194 TaxID=3346764 RepID=UPI0036986993
MSVVIATRDRMELLHHAVNAVFDQDYPGPIDVTVVFDQSEPAEITIEPRENRLLRTIRNSNTPGLAGARNSGIAQADGDYVAFCDDDDEWFPRKISAQLAAIEAHPTAVAAGCGIEVRFNGQPSPRLVPHGVVTFQHLLRDRVIGLNGSTLLIRRDVLVEKVGPVDERLPGSYAEDYDLMLRIAKQGPIPVVKEPLVAINWGSSFFADRFPTITRALTYLLDKHPEFDSEPAGKARVEGQIAFFHAAGGEHAAARDWAMRALRHNWRERRGYLALGIGLRLISAPATMRYLNARGRGI